MSLRACSLLLAVTLVGPGVSWARDAGTTSGRVVHVVDDDPAHVDVVIHRDHVVTVAFGAKVIHYTIPRGGGVDVEAQRGDVLLIRPRSRRARGGIYGTIHVRTSKGAVVLRLIGADSASVKSLVQIRHKTDEQIYRAAIEAEAKEIAETRTRELQEQVDMLIEALARSQKKIRTASLGYEAAQRDELNDYLTGPRCTPLPPDSPDEGIRIEHSDWLVIGSRRLAIFEVTNTGYEPYHVADFRIWGHRARRDHAGARLIGDDDAVPHGVIALIPPRMRVRGIARIMDPELVGPEIVYAMATEGGKQPIRSQPARTWDLTPLLEDPPDPPDENEGKVTVSLVATYGAVWIPTPLSMAPELDATSIQGYGARLSYGLHKRFNVEIDALLASTGEASFSDGGARSATLGRVQAGGQVRLGTGGVIPVLRGGVGLQGASYSGVGDGFEFDLTWQVGGGVELKAGPFVLGLGVGGGALMQEKGRWFEGGIHLGYAWKP